MIRFVFEETGPMRREEIPQVPYFRFNHGIIRRETAKI